MRVTEDLHAAVANVKQRIAQLPNGEEWASEQAYAEYEVIEGLIGTTFVLYQTYLESVVSFVQMLAKDGYAGAPAQRKDILVRKSNPVAGAPSCSRMEAINAVANYFKHRDGWTEVWWSATRQMKGTVDVIGPIGLSSSEYFNMMKAAHVLGDDAFDGTIPLVGEMTSWCEQLLRDIEEKS